MRLRPMAMKITKIRDSTHEQVFRGRRRRSRLACESGTLSAEVWSLKNVTNFRWAAVQIRHIPKYRALLNNVDLVSRNLRIKPSLFAYIFGREYLFFGVTGFRIGFLCIWTCSGQVQNPWYQVRAQREKRGKSPT